MTRLGLAAALLGSTLFAGCAMSQPVTEENAPTELMKKAAALSSESEASDVLDVMNQIIDATAQAYNYRIALTQSTDASNMAEDEENGVKAEPSKSEIYDVRYAGDKTVYELFEQEAGETTTAGLMKMTNVENTTVFADFDTGKPGDLNSEFTIASIQSQQGEDDGSSDEDIDAIVKNTVIYPLYSFCGQNLILQPNVNPEYYDFALTKGGDAYTLTMKMKDHDEYNEYLDTFVSENYGYERVDLKGDGTLIVDQYDTTELTITMTMDENGVLSEITNNNVNKIGSADKPMNIYSKQKVKIAQAPEIFDSFFDSFFTSVKDGAFAEGDRFSVEKGKLEPAADENAEEEDKGEENSAAKDENNANADKDSETKDDAGADAKDEGEESEKK